MPRDPAATTRDGRLELDDLGSVIHGAADLGDARDTLGAAPDEPTLTERVGLAAWAERHRALVRAVAVSASLVAVVLVIREATEPPPPRPDVVATIAPDLTATETEIRGAPDGGTTVTSVVLLSGERQGESVRVTGVRGPGIRTSTAIPVGETADGVGRWAVTAVVSCEGADEAFPTDGAPTPYSLALARTDAWGRVATSAVPAPAGDRDWTQLVGEACWAEQAARGIVVSGLTARADTSRGIVTVGFDVSSTLAIPALLGLLADSSPTIDVGQSFLAPLEPGRVAQIDATLRVTSCDDVRPPLVRADPRIRGGAPVPGLLLLVQAARDQRVATVPYVLGAAELAQVQGALDRVCSGAPRLTADVVGVRPAGTVPVGDTRGAGLTVSVRLASSTPGRTTVALQWIGYGYATSPQASGTIADLGPAGTTVDLSWVVSCPTTPPPPTLRIVVDVDGRAVPWSQVLDDVALEDGLLASCEGLTREMLVTSGWPVRRT